jgi:inner membrane protein
MTRARAKNRLLNPGPKLVIFAILLFAADQALFQWLGAKDIGFRGPFDETAHLLTTLLIVWALFPGFDRSQLLPVLVASCAIDLDHIPGQFGSTILTGGGPRPVTHSLATVAVLLLVALLWRRQRLVFLALMLGVMSHLWRDLAEPPGSAVPLFWPVTDKGIHLAPVFYLSSIAIFAGIALTRALTRAPLPVT